MNALKAKIIAAVAQDLRVIEAQLETNLEPQLEIVAKVAGHILFSGGKRLRPLLMVLSARLCGYKGDYAHAFATLFEYLHAATLLHDDLVDGAQLRRGRTVAHQIWGSEIAVLTGDFLLARALTLAAKTGIPKLIDVIAKVTENMSQGEIDQLTKKGRLDLSEKEYLEVIRRKTAVLFQGACRSGALISGAGSESERALDRYGYHLGLAFQMADDLLDYTAQTEDLGKSVGADLREGKLTLPVIFSLQKADAATRRQMEAIIADPEFSGAQFEHLAGLLQDLGGIAYTKQQARSHVDQSKAALQRFGSSAARDVLLDIADYALVRKN